MQYIRYHHIPHKFGDFGKMNRIMWRCGLVYETTRIGSLTFCEVDRKENLRKFSCYSNVGYAAANDDVSVMSDALGLRV